MNIIMRSSIFHSISRIGFVTQDDVLLPQLTVEETLAFAAFLRLPSSMSKEQKYAKVEMIIKELGLERYVHVLIFPGIVRTRTLSSNMSCIDDGQTHFLKILNYIFLEKTITDAVTQELEEVL